MSEAGEPSWFAVEGEVARVEVDVTSGALWAAGVGGIEEAASDGQRVLLVASVERAHLDAVTRAMSGAARGTRVRAIGMSATAGAPPAGAQPVAVGDVLVVPPGRAVEHSGSAPVVVRIDPGPAFGWGGHVTTRLALELLQQQLARNDAVLDVGTGSGVLAIAAARLGASAVVATDIDADARAVAEGNVGANGVRDRVQVVSGSTGPAARRYDLVVANLERPVLVGLAPALREVLVPRGHLVLSGFLVEHEPSVQHAFEGFIVSARRVEDGWAGLVLAPGGSPLS